jgi:hypothetical protein
LVSAQAITQDSRDQIVALHNILAASWATTEQLSRSLDQSTLDRIEILKATNRLSQFVRFGHYLGAQLGTGQSPAAVTGFAGREAPIGPKPTISAP